MALFWRVSVTSTGAGKVEKITPPSMGHKTPRLLGYDAYVYVGATGAAVNLIISEGESSVTHTSSATVGTIGRATEMQPVRAYSKAGLAVAPYISLEFSASAGTEVINMYGDYV